MLGGARDPPSARINGSGGAGAAKLLLLQAIMRDGHNVLPIGLAPRGLSRVHWARRVFFASMPYLVVLYAAFVAAV